MPSIAYRDIARAQEDLRPEGLRETHERYEWARSLSIERVRDRRAYRDDRVRLYKLRPCLNHISQQVV
jgi:hypothetical protein